MQYPFLKYLQTVLYFGSLVSPWSLFLSLLAVSDIILLMSCLAWCVLFLGPSIWKILLLPSLTVVILTSCFAFILLMLLAPCPITLPAVSAVVSIVSMWSSCGGGVVFRTSTV